MEMNLQTDGDKATITIIGSIDERGAEDMKRRLLEMDLASLKEVNFDFGAVTFVGSAGIGKLLLLYKSLASHDGIITINNMQDDIYTMFKVVKLDRIFNISKT